jgi:hypothetical protein
MRLIWHILLSIPELLHHIYLGSKYKLLQYPAPGQYQVAGRRVAAIYGAGLAGNVSNANGQATGLAVP